MPLTSARMLAVIRAGLAFHDALETAQALCAQQCEAVRNGGDATQALEFLRTMISPEALVNFNSGDDPELTYTHSYFALKSEERHFREFASSNARMRRYQARKRQVREAREMQIPTRDHYAPSTARHSQPQSSPQPQSTISSSADDYTDEDAQ